MPWQPWALYALSVLCFVVVYRAQSTGLALFCLFVALFSMVAATLMMAQARIQSRSQNPAQMLGPEELALIKARLEAKRQAEAAAESTPDAAASTESPRAL